MQLSRVMGVVIRQYYLIRGSFSRLVPLCIWVAVDIVLWGFLTRYLGCLTQAGGVMVSISSCAPASRMMCSAASMVLGALPSPNATVMKGDVVMVIMTNRLGNNVNIAFYRQLTDILTPLRKFK